jgi:hypothetical protein
MQNKICLEKETRESIEGMALYVEECMNEIRKQIMYVNVDMEIVKRRAARATGTTEELMRKVKEMA